MGSRLRTGWALAVLLLAFGGCSKSDAQSSPPARGAPAALKPLPITVAKAEAREVQRAVETIGSVVAWDDVQVRTEQPGTIARLLVDLGDAVTRGKVLAEYDAREFELAVKQAEADLLSAEQSLSRTRATVQSSEAALRRAKDNLVTLESEVTRTQSEVDWAKSELARTQELFRKELIAARDVDNSRNLSNVAAARMAQAVAARDQHPDQVRIAEAQLDSDRAALRVAEAEVARRDAGGQRIELSVEAYPGRTFAGQVTRVSPAVEVQTRSLALEGRVPNADGRLRPGFFAKGAVLTKKDGAVAFVPAEAVVYFVGISKVFVVGDGKVEERLVKAGARQGAWVEIAEGVKPGETVAVSNLSQLFNGAPVTLLESKIVK